MATWEDFLGLGSLIPPRQPQDQQPMLANPAAQAALLSFGLQAMNGGWGNGVQQAAQAIGAGAQGAGAYAGQEQERQRYADAQAERQAEREDRRSDRSATRQNALDIARMNNATRQEIAAMRNEAALGRVDDRMQIAQMNNRQRAEAALARQYPGLFDPILSQATRPEDRARMLQEYNTAMQRLRTQYPLATDPVPDDPLMPQAAPGGNSQGNRPVAPPARPAPAPAPAPAAPSASGAFWDGFFGGGLSLPRGPAPAASQQPPNAAVPQPAGGSVQPTGQMTPQAAASINRDMAAAARGDQAAVRRILALRQDPTVGPQVQQMWDTYYNGLRGR